MVAIKKMREGLGKTQQDMADALLVDRSTVAKWEAAGAYPRPVLFESIAKYLGCTIDDLFREEQGKTG